MNAAEIQRAIKSVSGTIKKKPSDSLSYRERAQLYILAGEYSLARADLEMTYQYDGFGRAKPGRLHGDLEINGIGTAYWMEGHLELAVSHWRYTVELHLLNRVGYSDSGVGVKAGLLLWFGAANLKLSEDLTRVEKHFKKRASSKYSNAIMAGVSGATARYCLREICEDQLLAEADGDPLLAEMDSRKKSRQQYRCQAHFAMAARAREEGRYKDYYRFMEEAAGPENADPYDYYNMWEFYLARHEAARRG